MNTKKVVFLFYSTFIIGTIAGFLIGFILDWQTHIDDIMNGKIGGFAMIFITASIWTIISQMGFFAYLTIHRFGLGIFRSTRLWNLVQIVLIAFALFDLVYFRHLLFAEAGESMAAYLVVPLLLLLYGGIVAYLKSKDTNRAAFVPALFFMVVVTTVEWIPALRENDSTFLITSIVPLLTANTWQLLVLHRLHEQGTDAKTQSGSSVKKAQLSKTK
ncbi:KinB signaling pathway activation protein [Evansella caseinilytica]|uniref:KinB signaling pathway activation protein n=1 Tax=Evansella caseinilytica TaxID=1503961 RepID=A0A1H3SIJ8_9BACI|nr:KinB-signaling pathway activation protein [Evansella caseinilytica]SDZ37520.1 KinB signaling pathway activation protein [Evansella caseinilytica]